MIRRWIMAAAPAGALVAALARADPASTGVSYQLDDDSSFETGCFPPCLCPILLPSPSGVGSR